MSLHMDAKMKTRILWGVIILALISYVGYRIHMHIRIERENAAQVQFDRTKVKPAMKKMDGVSLKKRGNDYSFNTEGIMQTLSSYQDQVRELEKECNEICDYLEEKASNSQPENVRREWFAKKERLENLKREVERIKKDAQAAYDRQVEVWEASGAKIGTDVQAKRDQIKKLIKCAVALYKYAGAMIREVVPEENAYYGYLRDQKKLKKEIQRLQKLQAQIEKEYGNMKGAMAGILRSDGKVNPDAQSIMDIVTLLNGICASEKNVIARWDKVVRIDPPTLPPPAPFDPDIRIATTGDLAEELARPLVDEWLKARNVKPPEGDSFVWNTPDEVTKEIEVSVPQSLQGKEPGKLRIRIITEQNSAAIFSWLSPGREKADLVLTGRSMSDEQRRAFETSGSDGEEVHRSRVCSDALLFFPGNGISLDCLNAEKMKEVYKVYSRDDAGRMEAASIFGFTPNGSDAVADDTRDKSIDSLREEYKNYIILGTWHRDSLRSGDAVSPFHGHELSYSSGISMDSSKVASAYRHFRKEYQNKGCHPSEPTINSQRYAYAYDINFYRSTTPKPEAAAGKDLLEWAGNAGSGDVAKLVRKRGFVPVMPQEPNADDQLTNEDLPIDKLIQKLPKSFGYTRDETVWIRGTRIEIPLLYDVGDSKVSVDSIYKSGVTKALEYMKKLTQGRRACLVLVGHADPQYGKKLDVGDRSWNFNDKLSRERADSIYTDIFGKECPDTSTLMHVTLGCSWALPVLDIDLSKGIAEQEGALRRCRRVEVFLVFPRDTEEKGEKKE